MVGAEPIAICSPRRAKMVGQDVPNRQTQKCQICSLLRRSVTKTQRPKHSLRILERPCINLCQACERSAQDGNRFRNQRRDRVPVRLPNHTRFPCQVRDHGQPRCRVRRPRQWKELHHACSSSGRPRRMVLSSWSSLGGISAGWTRSPGMMASSPSRRRRATSCGACSGWHR